MDTLSREISIRKLSGSHKAVSEVHCNERSAATICFNVFHVLVFLATALPFVVWRQDKPIVVKHTQN